MIQAAIGRLGNDSFLVKGWAVTVAGVFFGFAVNGSTSALAFASLCRGARHAPDRGPQRLPGAGGACRASKRAGLPDRTGDQLRALGAAAATGALSARMLLAPDHDKAMTRLQELPGIGSFSEAGPHSRLRRPRRLSPRRRVTCTAP